MKIGLQITAFDWPGGTAAIGPTLARIVRQADDLGFDSIWVMDHFFQIRGVGHVEDPMLEGWTTLGYIAANTSHARLGLMVGGVHYRAPGLWVKAATTLDVLSGGRAWLGIGAAWNERESRALGFPFPPLADRFEMLEETLQISHAMFEGERGTEEAFHGRQFQAERLLNSPQSHLAAARPDHGRRRRREEDAAARGPVRRRVQRVRFARGDRAQVRRSFAGTARLWAAIPTRSNDPRSRTSIQCCRAAVAVSPWSTSSSGSATSPTPARSTSSSACRTPTMSAGWTSSGETSCRPCGTCRWAQLGPVDIPPRGIEVVIRSRP